MLTHGASGAIGRERLAGQELGEEPALAAGAVAGHEHVESVHGGGQFTVSPAPIGRLAPSVTLAGLTGWAGNPEGPPELLLGRSGNKQALQTGTRMATPATRRRQALTRTCS
jgi:hypothetical protein